MKRDTYLMFVVPFLPQVVRHRRRIRREDDISLFVIFQSPIDVSSRIIYVVRINSSNPGMMPGLLHHFPLNRSQRDSHPSPPPSKPILILYMTPDGNWMQLNKPPKKVSRWHHSRSRHVLSFFLLWTIYCCKKRGNMFPFLNFLSLSMYHSQFFFFLCLLFFVDSLLTSGLQVYYKQTREGSIKRNHLQDLVIKCFLLFFCILSCFIT